MKSRNLTVTLKNRNTENGIEKHYETYDAFVADWRFWQSGGKESRYEEAFKQAILALNTLDVNGSKFTLTYSGIEITFTLIIKW